LRDGGRVVGEVQGHLGVLEIAEPIGDAEVHEIKDRRNAKAFDLRHRLIDERPVVAAGAEVDEMVRQSVAQAGRAQVLHEREILLEVAVVAALFEEVAADALAVGANHRWIGTSMPVAKAKSHALSPPGRSLRLRRRPATARPRERGRRSPDAEEVEKAHRPWHNRPWRKALCQPEISAFSSISLTFQTSVLNFRLK
jgi:hypothetical protein